MRISTLIHVIARAGEVMPSKDKLTPGNEKQNRATYSVDNGTDITQAIDLAAHKKLSQEEDATEGAIGREQPPPPAISAKEHPKALDGASEAAPNHQDLQDILHHRNKPFPSPRPCVDP